MGLLDIFKGKYVDPTWPGLQAGGNVEQAMRNMKRQQELGYLDESLDLEGSRGSSGNPGSCPWTRHI